MRERVRDFDWSATPLGPQAQWPSELRNAVDQILDSSFPQAVIWGPDLTTVYNDAFLPILGDKPEALGHSFADIWNETWDTLAPIAERAYQGEPTYIEDFPLTINRSGYDEKAWFTFCYSPLRHADGSVAGMLDTVVETTQKVRAQADLALVNQELGHRLKNTLALVQAIAAQSLKGSGDPQALRGFFGRLSALGHAHDILLRQDWSSASLRQVIVASASTHGAADQIEVHGPDMQIGSRAAVALSLILHELGTNAVKYGALSTPAGKVRLWWTIRGEDVCFQWHEDAGFPVSAPTRIGFGSRLIDLGLGGQSTVNRRFPETGLQVELHTKVGELLG